MPIYDYVCTSCGHTVEVVHGVHDHGPSACPNCGGTMRKAYSPPAVHFKGTGWAKKERASASTQKSRAHAGGAKGGESGDRSTTAGASGSEAGGSGASSGSGSSGSSSGSGASSGSGGGPAPD